MVQFIIKIVTDNATADVKTDTPSNFEDVDAKHFKTLDELIQTMTHKILIDEVTSFEDLWTVSELWRLPGISMFAKIAYKFEGFVDFFNGTFIEEITDLLESTLPRLTFWNQHYPGWRRDYWPFGINTTPGDKGKSIFEVDHTIELLDANIQKNLTDVPTFMKSLRTSSSQVMIRHLAKYSKDKDKEEDFIQHLLQKNVILTLENTQLAIDRTQTFLSREDRVDKIQTPKALVTSTTAPPDIIFETGQGYVRGRG